MKNNNKLIIKDLFFRSWKVYKNNWFNFILIGLLFVIVSMIAGYSRGFDFNNITGDIVYNSSAIMSFISWVISVYLGIGVIRYMFNLIDGNDVKLKSIFYGVDSISHFAFVVLVSIITAFIILFGTLLFIIPGIIASIGLMFSKYIIIENKGKNVEVLDAIKISWEITKGHRWKLLWICIVLFIFNIIGFLLIGIGLVVTIPVSFLIMIVIYRELESINKSNKKIVKKDIIETKVDNFDK